MNAIILYIKIIVIFIVTPGTAQPQILDDFSAQQAGSNVKLQWTFTSGETCSGTWIEHGTDSTSMTVIGNIRGICGSSDAPVTYSFVHEAPVYGKQNYYRLILGGRGHSGTISLYVDKVGRGFSIQGQPLVERSRIVFSDEYKTGGTIEVFNAYGRMEYSHIISERAIVLHRKMFDRGMHMVVIRYNNGKVFRGKLIVI